MLASRWPPIETGAGKPAADVSPTHARKLIAVRDFEARMLRELRNVSKSFGAIRAVSDVDLTVGRGEIVGLMGDNGAGKSTMIKLIAGNYPPTSGEIVIDDEVVHFHKP